ncbi:MAG: DnaD domain-containing protein [Anaerolineae bacterium]
MKGFTGFPAGKVRFTPLPDLFFSELLPMIDNLAECKVSLHVLWLLYHKKGHPRCVNLSELEQDQVLRASLKCADSSPKAALQEGLERAVARGTLLQVTTEGDDGQKQSWYFPNNEQGRRAIAKIKSGSLKLEGRLLPEEAPVVVERPNIFVLYEQNIGLLQPIIAEELRDAERTYPAEWIEAAFKIAVERNARNWRYIQRILERWATEGKDDGESRKDRRKTRRRYIEGEYADYIEH